MLALRAIAAVFRAIFTAKADLMWVGCITATLAGQRSFHL